jgi:tRNA modification GTPase
MFSKNYPSDDTIVAIATANGKGAIGIIRISGRKAFHIAEKLCDKNVSKWNSHTIHLSSFYDNKRPIDQGLVLKFDSPNTYTGEDVIELNCHGSPLILNLILNTCIQLGGRLASPGEFTFRAFINGKLDLSQAEAVSDVINAENEVSLQNSLKHLKGGFSKSIGKLKSELIHFASLIELELDFGEEDVEFADRSQLLSKINELISEIDYLVNSFKTGNAITKGIPVAIVGKPNAGKSSLLNTLLNDDRAIVSDIAGTTRDTIEELFNIKGVAFRLIDTAGIRISTDQIEQIGIEKAFSKIKSADIILYLIDAEKFNLSEIENFIEQNQSTSNQIIFCINKIDLIQENKLSEIRQILKSKGIYNSILISCHQKESIEQLKIILTADINHKLENNNHVLTNSRHYNSLIQTNEHLLKCQAAIEQSNSHDMLAEDLRMALHHLSEITGDISNDDLLENIFRNFCIGK